MACNKISLDAAISAATTYAKFSGLVIVIVKRNGHYGWCEPRYLLKNDVEVLRVGKEATSKVSLENEITPETAIEYEDL